MKRAISSASVALVLVALAGCSPAPGGKATDAQAETAGGWTRPPMIQQVTREGASLVVTGLAEPGARVVLRGESSGARAAVADGGGRFEIRMDPPVDHVILRPETQVGQDAAPSPDQLLLVDGGRGPIAILSAGGATRRLDRAPALGAIDGDGRQRIASGRTAPGTRALSVTLGGEATMVTPAPDGVWTVMLPASGSQPVRIGAVSFVWPDERAGSGDDLAVTRGEGGWSVAWTGPDGARQWTWLPTATNP